MLDHFQRAMWFCAGVDYSLARPLRTERVALTSAGTAVFLTAVLAFISGSYALFFVFDSLVLALAFGCLWSAIIFNLDRFVVSSMRKRDDILSEIIIAAPRALIAVIISFVIIVPLELRLFQTEIEQKISEHGIELMTAYAAALDHGPIQRSIEDIEARIKQIQQELSQLEDLRTKLAQDPEGSGLLARIASLDAQLDDLPKQQQLAILKRAEYLRSATQVHVASQISGQPNGDSEYRSWLARAADQTALAQRATNQITLVQKERNYLTTQLHDRVNLARANELHQQLENQEKQREALVQEKRKQLEDAQKDSSLQKASLLTRLTILGRLAAENKVADWTIILLRLLVVAVELSPILIKLGSPKGPYEAHLIAAAQEEFPKDTQ